MRPPGIWLSPGALLHLPVRARGGIFQQEAGILSGTPSPSCGTRRMAETAALLADEVFPDVPLRRSVISFPFPLRYLFAAHPQAMGNVLGIVYRAISTHLIQKSGLSLKNVATGAATLIQRFGCDIQVHILFLDGVYVYRDNRPPRFQRVKAPNKSELEDLVQSISQRVARSLERQGLLEQDTESAWLDLDPAEDADAMPQLLGSSISYRIAVGPQQGRKAFMIRTLRPLDRHDPRLERAARANGFSLHAGISREGNQKDKREARTAFRRDGIFPDRPQEFPTFTEFHGQGGLHPEDTVSGWNDTSGIRTGGFRCPSVCPGT